jgi:CRP-like cAMP-binding protein
MATTNLLLTCLPRDVYARIEPDLKPHSFKAGHVLHHPGDKINDLYFPTTCMISVTVRAAGGQTIEVDTVGNREVVGINALMGDRETTFTEYIVQVAGDAVGIAANAIKKEFNRNTEMRYVMLKYVQAMIAEISQNVACNRIHSLDERCARWLLEVRERIESDEIPLTQHFIAEMLGVRRASVAEAVAKLKRKKILGNDRGRIHITNVQGLEKASCECYRALKKEYDRLLGTQS